VRFLFSFLVLDKKRKLLLLIFKTSNCSFGDIIPVVVVVRIFFSSSPIFSDRQQQYMSFCLKLIIFFNVIITRIFLVGVTMVMMTNNHQLILWLFCFIIVSLLRLFLILSFFLATIVWKRF